MGVTRNNLAKLNLENEISIFLFFSSFCGHYMFPSSGGGWGGREWRDRRAGRGNAGEGAALGAGGGEAVEQRGSLR